MNSKLYYLDILDKKYYMYLFDNCHITKHLIKYYVWEGYMHNVFKKYVNKNSVVVECGCHVGLHSLPLATMCKTFIGFEPMPVTFELLTKNIEINGITNATIYEKGIANREGSTKYCWIPHHNIGGAGLEDNPLGIPSWIKRTNQNIEVELTTIDLLQLDKLDFMKIDVEGYETLVIQGAMKTIEKCKPVIVMEVWENHDSKFSLDFTKKTFKNILDLGYDVQQVSGPDFLFVPK